jgi:carbonic anhydrase/acetyltransferase-like protein (isoleucine patch superfamily)
LKSYLEDYFDIHPSTYVAPSARIYGKVTIGAFSSIWDGVVIRGDMAPIEIGANTSIQENAVVHVDFDIPTQIGNNVTVGHGAIIHGAKVGDFCVIAINSVLLNNSVVGAFNCRSRSHS